MIRLMLVMLMVFFRCGVGAGVSLLGVGPIQMNDYGTNGQNNAGMLHPRNLIFGIKSCWIKSSLANRWLSGQYSKVLPQRYETVSQLDTLYTSC